MRLNYIEIKGWKDLVGVFVKQYNFKMDINLNKFNILVIEKREKESVQKYGQRWRKKDCLS